MNSKRYDINEIQLFLRLQRSNLLVSFEYFQILYHNFFNIMKAIQITINYQLFLFSLLQQLNFFMNLQESERSQSFLQSSLHESLHFATNKNNKQSFIADSKDKNKDSIKQFTKIFQEKIIVQWHSGYINYLQLLPLLKQLEKVYSKYHKIIFFQNNETLVLAQMPAHIREYFQILLQNIHDLLQNGIQKSHLFQEYILSSIILDWNLLMNVIKELSQSEQKQLQITTQDQSQNRHYIKQIIKVIFTKIQYSLNFADLNQKISEIVKYQIQINAYPFQNKINLDPQKHSQQKLPKRKRSAELIQDIVNQNNQICKEQLQIKQLLKTLETSLKSLYSSLVFHNLEKTGKLQSLTSIAVKTDSYRNYFLMGLYIGLGSVTILALIILLISDLVALKYDEKRVDSMNYIFPMFRGVGLLILYLWGIAWNAYGFTKFRINYRLILQYGSHYSTHFQIMKRAGFFTLVFAVMLLIYCVLVSNNSNNKYKSTYLAEYTPFVVWVLYFTYIFFPNREIFNPKGRKYFYNLIKKIIFSPILKITFLITWASDQAVSFVIPFKDFAYTICFYTSQITVQDVKDCLNAAHIQGVIVTYIVAIIPLLIRMIQCYKQAKQQSGKFIGHLQMWNFFKYFSSVLTATLSFLSTIQANFLYLFLISSVFSTLYSYYWDLKNDWGFLQKSSKHKFLRNHLSYNNQRYYYLAICINLLFRCSWTLTISPSIATLLHKSTFLPFVTGFIQILRRCMWNFFRIQKQHVINCKQLSIMKYSVDKLIQKIKKKQIQEKLQSIEPESQKYLGYGKFVNKQFLQKLIVNQKISLNIGNINMDEVNKKKQIFLQALIKQEVVCTKIRKNYKQASFFELQQSNF